MSLHICSIVAVVYTFYSPVACPCWDADICGGAGSFHWQSTSSFPGPYPTLPVALLTCLGNSFYLCYMYTPTSVYKGLKWWWYCDPFWYNNRPMPLTGAGVLRFFRWCCEGVWGGEGSSLPFYSNWHRVHEERCARGTDQPVWLHDSLWVWVVCLQKCIQWSLLTWMNSFTCFCGVNLVYFEINDIYIYITCWLNPFSQIWASGSQYGWYLNVARRTSSFYLLRCVAVGYTSMLVHLDVACYCQKAGRTCLTYS